MPPRKHIAFDVVGTLVSYQAFFDSVDKTIGSRLKEHGITAQIFAHSWMQDAELEFTFLSMAEAYVRYLDVMKAQFYRTAFQAGISEPRSLATEQERDEMLASYSQLQLRPGAREAIEKLRAAGVEVWCFTSGDKERVKGYFDAAGFDMPEDRVVSCDSERVSKPALAAYRSVFERFPKEDEKWFAAAHMWDVSAARRVGFKGAYCTVYEKEPNTQLYVGDMEVIADTLVEMAEKVIAHV
ncbi:HAD-like protein [Teratosphaeria nubilosa]|uniref:HAD-like protein n=1 Tax=Teratosphaeria nubilosa TaxID=161662 RepID=A0A6G1LC99_9PEZI|nr:HAD-like protein [Teratosphaeria nubilosa]